MQGQVIAGRYRLDDVIGSGGMGRVWRAHDELLNRVVAIKELTAALYVAEGDQERLLARTRAEARAAARINHAAVVTVHDVFEHDGRPWIVMELVEGRSLADAVEDDGRVEPAEAARIGLWVLRALRAAHSAGVLHRDVKPGNVLLSDDGRVLLTDFGIAQIEGDTTITRTGEVVGSVDYLAPERVRGEDPGPSCDLWALGATLYTAVEGRSPFRRTSPLTTMQAVVDEEALKPQYAGPLGSVITALLRKDPAARPDTAEAEYLLAEAAEGRGPSGAQAYAGPGQKAGRDTEGSGTRYSAGATQGSGTRFNSGATQGTHGSGTYDTSGGEYVPEASTPVPATRGSGPLASQHPTTGSTSVGTTGLSPDQSSARRRRRLPLIALVVFAAALVGGGTAVTLLEPEGLQQAEGFRSVASPDGLTDGEAPAAAGTATAADDGIVPDTWKEIDDPLGFGLSLPEGWERQVFQDDGDLKQIDYTPNGGEHFIRIAVDASPDFADPYAHQLDLEQQVERLVDYERVTLERNIYRDREGAEWEYTWTALAKDTEFPGARRAIEETYVARDGTEYAIYMSSPADDWDTTVKQFRAVLQSWREPQSTS